MLRYEWDRSFRHVHSHDEEVSSVGVCLAVLVPLMDQLETPCVQCLPGRGLIGKVRGAAEDLDQPLVQRQPTSFGLPLEPLEQVILQVNGD